MPPIVQLLILAVVQGLTEFLPVSSSGHLVLLQNWIGSAEGDVFLDVVLHVGTLGSVLWVYRREVLRLWPTSYRLGDGRPIWVGNLTVQEKEIVINLLAFPVTTAVEIPASETLYAQVSPSLPARATLMVTATDPGLTR